MSIAIDQGIYETLRDNAGVAALVAGRIYPGSAPEEAASPYIVYALTESDEPRSLDGSVRYRRFRYTIACHDDVYDDVVAVVDAVYAAFGGDNATTKTFGPFTCVCRWDEAPSNKRKSPDVDRLRNAGELDLWVMVKRET